MEMSSRFKYFYNLVATALSVIFNRITQYKCLYRVYVIDSL